MPVKSESVLSVTQSEPMSTAHAHDEMQALDVFCEGSEWKEESDGSFRVARICRCRMYTHNSMHVSFIFSQFEFIS